MAIFKHVLKMLLSGMLLAACTAFAQTGEYIAQAPKYAPRKAGLPPRAPVKRRPPPYEFSHQGELGFSVRKNQLGEYAVNPKNSILGISDTFSLLRASADLRWKGGQSRLVIRPLLDLSSNQVVASGVSSSKSKTDPDLLEAFWDWNNTPDSKFTLGLQSYQWGPAELMSPSNGLFHFGRDQRSLFFKEKGKGLLRWNYGLGQFWSFVAMYEAVDNREPQWVYGQGFEAKKVIKIEKSLEDNPVNYYGLTIGTAEFQKLFLGGYLNYSYVEGKAFYLDLRFTEDPQIFRPAANRLGYDSLEIQKASNPAMLGILGMRIEGDYDSRVELVHNDGGYSKAELARALKASRYPNPVFPVNLAKLVSPGLEFMQKNYLYISHRIPDCFSVQTLNISLRGLLGITASGGNFQFALDYGLNDYWTWMNEATYTQAQDDNEFSLVEKVSLSLGLKRSF